ncbi:SAM-dependent methyltransferase HcgC family protein [Methanopyrus kandleri]
MKEPGITDLTETVQSRPFWDVVREIGLAKAEEIAEVVPEGSRILVLGAYLTGIFVAELLSEEHEITVLDPEPALRKILPSGVRFRASRVPPPGRYDVVIDLTGLGGTDPRVLRRLNPEVLVVENPAGNMNDPRIEEYNDTEERLEAGEESYELRLFDAPFEAKTSGTFTLSVRTVREAANRLERHYGVLYAVPGVVNIERWTFRLRRPEEGVERAREKPAVTVSQLTGSSDPDEVIGEVLDEILFEIRER